MKLVVIFRISLALSLSLTLKLNSFAAADGNVCNETIPASVSTKFSAVRQPPTPTIRGPQKTEKRLAKVRLALTLAGGGARGVAHIGVLKVLEQEGIQPDLITANSAGALIGSLYAAGLSSKEIEDIALDGRLKKAYFPRPRFLQSILYGARYSLARLLFLKPKIGLYSGKSISRFIEKTLPEGVEAFSDLKIPLVVTSINLIDTKPVWISSGKIASAVRASNTVPFFYRSPGSVKGPQLVDGGIRADMPTRIAEVAGAPLVVAVKLHSYLKEVPRSEFDTYSEYAERITSILMAEIEQKAISDADILIEPKVQFMTTRSFKKDDIRRAISEGEIAARKMLPDLVAKLRISKLPSGISSRQFKKGKVTGSSESSLRQTTRDQSPANVIVISSSPRAHDVFYIH